MKFGLCAGLDSVAQVAALGFEYIELPVSGLAELTEEGFAQKRAEIEAVGIPCPCFNLLFPKTMTLLDGSTDQAAIDAYLHRAFSRVRRVGGKVVVFGSGKSRNRPEGLSYGDAMRRLTEITRRVGELAGEYGITVVIEPLNRGESNMICSMAEGAALAAAVNHPHVALLADYYHVAVEGEPLTDIARLGGVTHTHIATRQGRKYPVERAGDQFELFFAQLKETGYTGYMSIEGKADSIEVDAPRALALLKGLEEEA